MSGFGYNVNGFGSFPSRGPGIMLLDILVIGGGAGGGNWYYAAGGGGAGGAAVDAPQRACAQVVCGHAGTCWEDAEAAFEGGHGEGEARPRDMLFSVYQLVSEYPVGRPIDKKGRHRTT